VEAVESELTTLLETCKRQALEIQTLDETVSVFRKGAHALSVENARLRSEVSTLRALAQHARLPALDPERIEARLPLDARTPAAARALVAELLRERMPHDLLERARQIVSELLARSLTDNGETDRFVVLRIESSPGTVRLEVDDPGRTGVTGDAWGGERVPTGGTRSWAQLALGAPSA
jgi:hypothetical protein